MKITSLFSTENNGEKGGPRGVADPDFSRGDLNKRTRWKEETDSETDACFAWEFALSVFPLNFIRISVF